MAERSVSQAGVSGTGRKNPLVIQKGKVIIEVKAIGGSVTFDIERTSDGGASWRKVDEGGAKASRTLASGEERVLVFEEFENPASSQSIQVALNFTTLTSTADYRIAQ